ncbi:DUF58 domain-containing protein [Faunimonas sp. B44]|uniref:DUF58 domain-containing protein n=1 Tax=Faunimonas sp. B44 TaxID=3461493 RepID=UPI004043987C
MIDTRAYSNGDDIRHIDRNLTARTGVLHVRTFHDERDKSALLLADFRPSMLWGTRRAFRSVAAAEILSAIGWRVVEAGGRIGLIAFGAGEPTFVAPRGRSAGMIRVIGGLVDAHRAALRRACEGNESGEPDFERGIDMARELASHDMAVFLATSLDGIHDASNASLAALARKTALSVLLVRDAFECDPPRGSYRFAAAGRPVNTATVRGRQEAAPSTVATRLRALGVRVIPLRTSGGVAGMLAELDNGHAGIR